MRNTIVAIRDMQKPKIIPDMRNLWPCLWFICRIVMWATAPRMKRTRKTAVMGISRPFVGRPPRADVVGG